MNIDIRKHIISNFKDSSVDEIRDSIVSGINSNDEIVLPGLGVLFEILWKNVDDDYKNKDISFIFKDLEERMKQIMGTKVVINRRDNQKGKVEIEYYSQAELERIVELLESIR